ncbi:uncharacterized protein Dvar_77000 [Desulfosarcina variabilis str. Montpellier]
MWPKIRIIANLVAENIALRQQLAVMKRGKMGTVMFLCVSFHRVRLQIHLFPHQIVNLAIQLSCFV